MIIAIAVIVGIIVGWWLTMVIASAAISRSQARMQREINYWQAQSARASAWSEQPTQHGPRPTGSG